MKRQFSLSTLVALLAQASVGCGTTPSPDATSEAALESEAPASFELIQAGFFHNDVARQSAAWRVLPKLVHIGFADARPPLAVREGDDGARPSWEGVQDIPIEYDAEGANKAVVVSVPSEHRGKAFALFAMKIERFDGAMGASAQWLREQSVDLKAPAGRVVGVDAQSYAAYPFAGECFQTRVGREPAFAGKRRGVVYGFTGASRAAYESNNDVAWVDVEGAASHEGFAPVSVAHDGGYKGTYVSSPLWLRVPEGKSLVFKASLSRYEGVCYFGDDTKEIAGPAGKFKHLTKTYFQED